ncbi:MAG: hypothetical protein JST00_30230 [Deltaproteobacteria bacterium]|nr:hypothetical protein [Deltaproteobacteria bacterium]
MKATAWSCGAAIGALLLVSCTKRDDPPKAIADAGGPTSSSSASASASAASAASSAQEVDAGPVVVSLLHHTDAEITLSSRVDNPRDYPEHLVDGKPSTAWNGRTGDLHAWIEVKLEPRVHVTALEITAGFDKGDLFEKNHRIKALRFERDGKMVSMLAVDPSKRGLQRFPVDVAGGVLKLTVEETEKGSNEAWKEVVVSELRVLGTAPPDLFRPESRLPKMKVAKGSAAPPAPAGIWEVPFEGREGASLEAICAAWRADVMKVVRREQAAGHGLDGYREEELKCKASPGPQLEGTLPHGWETTSSVELRFFDGVAEKDDYFLFMKRSDGVHVIGPMQSTANDIGDSPVPGFWRAAVVDSRGEKALIVSAAAAWHSPYDSRDADGLDIEHTARVCRVTPQKITCDEPRPTVFLLEKLDGKRGAKFKEAPRAKLPRLDPSTGKMIVAR